MAADRQMTDAEIEVLGQRLDQEVINRLRIQLNIDPQVVYDQNHRVKTVTLSWPAFLQLALPQL